jgi:hypothetical protein
MHTPFRLSLVAGLSVAGVGAAAAQSDPCVWRYYVTHALHAQQHHERYFADGSLAPSGDTALR